MREIVIDIETSLDHKTIWFAVTLDGTTGKHTVHHEPAALREYVLQNSDARWIGHNLIGFDAPVLRDVWGVELPKADIYDTLVACRLWQPTPNEFGADRRGAFSKQHTLKAWAVRAGQDLKEDFDTADFDRGNEHDIRKRMIDYCIADVKANWCVYRMVRDGLKQDKFTDESLRLEHEIAFIVDEMCRTGMPFDFMKGSEMFREHRDRMTAIQDEMQEKFPPIVTERYSETQIDKATGKPKRLKDKVEVFNVGSRQMVASRLEALGAKWPRQTEKGNIIVDEAALKYNAHIPEAGLVLEYMTLQKHAGLLEAWLNNVGADGRLHGRVISNGAVTGRMTHRSPNLGQVPKGEYRKCFVVDEGYKMVGCDASGLELRMLAHYMNDPDYTETLLNGDIHSANQAAAGLPTRDNAKTFIYGFLYGAGDEKIGSIVNGNARRGKELKEKFLRNTPALSALIGKVKTIAKKGSVPGLDGRRIWIRHEHAALNSLLQSAGAIVMKYAVEFAVRDIEAAGLDAKLLMLVHDEMQFMAAEQDAEQVGTIARQAIIKAGEHLNMRCPLDGEYMVGDTWNDTH